MDAPLPSPLALATKRQQQRNHPPQHTVNKKVRPMPASNNTEKPNIAAVSWDAMPRCMLSEIGKFAGKRSSLSRASRTTLKAIPAAEVHLKIDTVRKYKSFFEQGFYDEGFCGEESQSSLIDPATGGLKSGRVVAHITVTAAMTSRRSEETPPPWHSE
ncbi:unnamed protein product, partial [Pylaiella littoralis]